MKIKNSKISPDGFSRIRDKASLINGLPKSGTTLLLALLDHHPQLTVLPEEMQFFAKVYLQKTPLPFLNRVFGKFGRVISDDNGKRDYLDIDCHDMESKLNRVVKTANTPKDLFVGLISVWHEVQPGVKDKRVRWVEKSPGNEQYVSLCHEWFGPNAVYLHMIRDPRDNYAGYRRLKLRRNHHVTPKEFCVLWARSCEIGIWAREHIPHYDFIRYEDLVNSPENELNRICQCLGIEFTEALLHPTRNGKPWYGNSVYGAQYAGISLDSIGKFRQELMPEEIHILERYLGKYMEEFGYLLSNLKKPEIEKKFSKAVKQEMFLWRLMITTPRLYYLLKVSYKAMKKAGIVWPKYRF